MDERTNYLLVGGFVLTAIVATIGLILWVADIDTANDPQYFVIVFERDVSGLTPGSPVRYLGVDVGQVSAIRLIADEGHRVAVQIAVAQTTPIDRGTYASLTYQGITGVAFVSLASEAGYHAPLGLDGEFDYPVIPTRSVGLAALLDKSGDITTQVGTALDSINALLGSGNRATLENTLVNLEQLTGALASQSGSIEQLPLRVSTASEELQRTLARINTLLDATQPEIVATIDQLQDAAQSIASIAGQLDRAVGGNSESLDRFVAEGLGEVPVLIAAMRGTLREFDKLLASLRDDPSRLVHQPQRNAIEVDP